jgi:hypothetical protein
MPESIVTSDGYTYRDYLTWPDPRCSSFCPCPRPDPSFAMQDFVWFFRHSGESRSPEARLLLIVDSTPVTPPPYWFR